MLIVGINGLFGTEDEEFMPDLPMTFCHDASAALVRNGEVVMAVEEERLNRNKHTNSFPLRAIRKSLEAAGVGIGEVDRLAYCFEEDYTDKELFKEFLFRPEASLRRSRESIIRLLQDHFAEDLGALQIDFHTHHEAHAALAYLQSGFDRSAVCILDGNGERDAVTTYLASGSGLEAVARHGRSKSLGHFYTSVTRLLGFNTFDEYKVMGLAPYGDRERFRAVLESLVVLGGHGAYELAVAEVEDALLGAGFVPRRRGEGFRAEDYDLAAAAQATLERIVLHILSDLRERTGAGSLCLAGGVAQNSAMNGAILGSGVWERVFVHPAAHDGGAALGAALLSAWQREGEVPRSRASAYLGPDLGTGSEVASCLARWSSHVDWEARNDLVDYCAEALADGAVIGWVQGRSEYGPRALGNRSILADPRPAENKMRINALIKAREAYRPFAPAATEEAARRHFKVEASAGAHEFMGFVVDVVPESRGLLGAVTHVDGTARLQIVGSDVNPRFHRLLKAFEALTGLGVLLNTSLNNSAEPIVQGVDDAVTTLLTSELDLMVIGDFVVRRNEGHQDLLGLCPSLYPLVRVAERAETNVGTVRVERFVASSRGQGARRMVSEDVYRSLLAADGRKPLGELIGRESGDELPNEWFELWRARFVRLAPPPA